MERFDFIGPIHHTVKIIESVLMRVVIFDFDGTIADTMKYGQKNNNK